ncbi:MAG TPA: serine hydrolase domain-containing protein [Rhizomicrobium sp.]|nr:serine hydrolase domain-containing protein [Rhizomicrobium sp.]
MKSLVVAALLATASSAQAPEIPDTPAGRVLAAWVSAVNSGNEAKAQAYADKYHRKSTGKDYVGLHQALGDLTVLKIEKNEPNDVVVVLGEANFDEALRSEFKTDPADPDKLVFAQSAGTDRPDDVAIPRLARDAALKATIARVEAGAAKDKYMGVVLIEDHGRILLEKAWGYGDREKKIPLKVTDKFRLGSMNKMFTAVATLQLVGQGKLSLDGTVGQYLPGYPNKEIADKVTIRMLLTHVGGTGEIFGDEFDKHRLELKTLDDYVTLYGARGPEFPPGSTTSYSNYGFILLGAIVAKASGEDYYDYVRDHIFKPAGMTDSGSLPETESVPGRVNGYTDNNGKWVLNTDTLPWRGTSAGGGYSTLADLLKFAHAMMDGKLLPADLRDAATRSETNGDWYGYGFELHGTGLAHSYGHTGGAPGMATEMRVYPQVKVVAIELSNIDPGAPAIASYYTNRMPLVP